MIKKICFLVNYNLYESKRHFTQKLAEACNRKNIATEIIDVEEQEINLGMIEQIKRMQADLTCSFNTLLPTKENHFLWDILKTPHLSILVDPALYAVNETNSPFTIQSVVDRNDVLALHQYQFTRVFFLPHAVEPELDGSSTTERPLDVVFLGTCYDYKSLRTSWREKNSDTVNKVLDHAIDLTVSDQTISLVEALIVAWKTYGTDEEQPDFTVLFYYLDQYVRGRDRVELIRSIQDVPVHVFGELSHDNAFGVLGWEQYLSEQENVTLYPSVPFHEGLEIQKKSKLCLNSMPFFRDGSHERILTALACGAVPLTSESFYVRDHFVEGEDLLFYQSNNWEAVNEKVVNLLNDEPRRQAMAASGRKKVMEAHTWDSRVDKLLEELPPFLDKMKQAESKA